MSGVIPNPNNKQRDREEKKERRLINRNVTNNNNNKKRKNNTDHSIRIWEFTNPTTILVMMSPMDDTLVLQDETRRKEPNHDTCETPPRTTP